MDKHGFSSPEPQKRSLIWSEFNFDLPVLHNCHEHYTVEYSCFAYVVLDLYQ